MVLTYAPIVGLVGTVVLVVFFAHLAAKRRTAMMKAWADANRYSFEPFVDSRSNVLRAGSVEIYDFSYMVGGVGGSSRPRTIQQTVVAMSGERAPNVLLRRFFSPAVRAHFSQLTNRDLAVEVRDEKLLVHHGRLLKTHDAIDALLADAVNLRRQWS